MYSKETTIETLNDLIRINNDRIAGYHRAVNELGDLDIDLKATFSNFMADSEMYKKELVNKVEQYGGNAEDGSTTIAGKIYRAWMDVKATFTGSERKGVLASCEFGEDAAQRAYEAAIELGSEIAPDALSLINTQKSSLRKAHDIIKNYRDMYKTIG